jgi:hypothetical protein
MLAIMNKSFCLVLAGTMGLITACNNGADEHGKGAATDSVASAGGHAPGSFGADLSFLQKHDEGVIVLEANEGKAQVIVSPKYQAKVFTSTADGLAGRSFGWIHYTAFEGPADPHMNGYGGENRLWLGPEGGKFSLYFKAGDSMVFDNWHTPGDFDTAAWKVVSKSGSSASLRKDMELVNYAGTHLSLSVSRDVSILSRQAIDELLHVTADSGVKAVGYTTKNVLTNTGQHAWTEQGGMPCIWMLDMFNPSPATTIVIPYKEPAKPGEKVATTDYFGEIPSDRIKYDGGVLFFKADGKRRGKLGIHPRNAKPVAGSYDDQNKILTITLFDVDSAGKYLNQEWNTKKPAFSGDAVNAYNDGPLADGKQMGPFYEIESVSPAVALKAGASLTHSHTVLHFIGDEAGLDRISQAWLGVGLDAIRKKF